LIGENTEDGFFSFDISMHELPIHALWMIDYLACNAVGEYKFHRKKGRRSALVKLKHCENFSR